MASPLYISASTNRHPHAADVSPSSVVAFGSSSLIALWDTSVDSDPSVGQTLPGHQGLVTAVRFLSDSVLLSADNKGVLKVWKRSTSGIAPQWALNTSIAAHGSPISSLCILSLRCVSSALVLTGSSDATVKVWELNSGENNSTLEEKQQLSLKGKYPMSLAISCLPQCEALVLAIGGSNRNIEIWTRSEDSFIYSLTIPGHEDWIRGLAFRTETEATLVLASASQDATIRLWNIESISKPTNALKVEDRSVTESPDLRDPLSDDLLDAFEASLGEVGDAEEGGRQISLKKHVFTVKAEHGNRQYSLTFDALLVGHEAGITSITWRPSSARLGGQPTLLSTSTDSSVILWSPSAVNADSSSIWINRQRFGDIGGQRLGGFVGGLWGRDGDEVLAWGWAGGWRRWRCVPSKDTETNTVTDEKWVEVGAVSGHNGPVKGLSWSPGGEYIISAGVDQTTRIHGPIQDANGKVSWHELSRPQIHGYDMVDVAFLNPLTFVSIADEKVLRVFEAPKTFVSVLDGLGIVKFTDVGARPQAASVPALGLSNKAIAEVPSRSAESSGDAPATRRPFEGELASTTLWPEVEKLFGHGYESISLASSNRHHLIATACRATSAEHAVVRLYDTEKYKPVGSPIQGHALTVTRIAFSPDDRYILSVSRDRSWILSEVQEDGGYVPIVADKSHGRIIWDCAWAREGDIFATASRDKTVRLWNIKANEGQNKWTPLVSIKAKEAATSVDFCTLSRSNSRALAIGLESGEILVYTNTLHSPAEWKLRITVDTSMAHVNHVYRLAWRFGQSDDSKRELASCSEDGILKILCIDLS